MRHIYKMKHINPIVYLDVKVEDEKIGRIIIELFSNVVPKTAENFLSLCVGNYFSPRSGKKLHFKGSIFHKVIPGLFIQGGDVVNLDGSSGESIYGLSFEDENYSLKHDRPGVLSAVNSGQNKNNSQFIITVGNCSHLDGTSVVFGQVIKGLACAIEISEVKTEDFQPVSKCIIEDCGQLLPNDPWNFIECDETKDEYPPDPRDLVLAHFKVEDIINIISIIKESGNYYFANQNYLDASRKYKKGMRYINYWTSPNFCLMNFDDSEMIKLQKELEEIKKYLLLNYAAVALKRGLYKLSLNLCDEVVKKEKHSAKAYFRRGIALKCLNDFEGALEEQKKALLLAPNDKSIIEEINSIFSLKKNYLLHEKRVFSRMFHDFK